MTVHNPDMPVVFPHGFQITADLIELNLIHTFAIILHDDLQYLAFLTNLDQQPELPILHKSMRQAVFHHRLNDHLGYPQTGMFGGFDLITKGFTQTDLLQLQIILDISQILIKINQGFLRSIQ